MLWDTTYPSDDIQANTLDVPLRNSKLLIRERAVMYNGAWNEHSFFGDGATGAHPLSQVGWVAIHSDYNTMVAGQSTYPDGSLHYAIGFGLYVYSSGTFYLAGTLDHSKLTIAGNDYHTQYYRRDSSRPMATELRLSPGGSILEDSPGSASDNPMGSAHDSLSWYDGHGANGELIINRHFADRALGGVKSTYLTGQASGDSPNPKAQILQSGGAGQRMSIPNFNVIMDGLTQIGDLDLPYNTMTLYMDPNQGSSVYCYYGFSPFGTGTPTTPDAYGLSDASAL